MKTPEYEEELKRRDDRQKHWDGVVTAAIRDVELSHLKRRIGFHHTTFFGAMGIDPKHLAIWCFFDKDEDLQQADEEGFTRDINTAMRERLISRGYPPHLISSFSVSFASDEDVQRTCEGNYWHYLK